MKTEALNQGDLVEHPKKPEWGLGKVLTVEGDVVKVHFKEDSERDYRAIRTDVVDLIKADQQSDPILDNLPPFLGDQFEVKSMRVTMGDGIAHFNHLFPLGFSDPKYLSGKGVEEGGAGNERDYKWRVHERFVETLGEGRGEKLLSENEISALVEKICVIANINLLSLYESSAFREGIRANEAAARTYLAALFEFIRSGPDKRTFETMVDALHGLPIEEGRARAATWPVLTLFPYMAEPTRFMFLKPGATKECAARLRFDLRYDSALNWETYERLMVMSELLLERLRPLGARDFIDVQSFVWVISEY